jgi:hypothetical protein
MKFDEIYFAILIAITIILIAVIVILYPGELYLIALRDWGGM